MRPLRTLIASLAALALLAALPAAAAAARAGAKPQNSCLDCHRELDDARLAAPAKAFREDVHGAHGLGCIGCHGGDPTDTDITSMDPDKGFKGTPARKDIAEMCATCHASVEFMKRYNPQPYIFSMAEFRTSVHCKRIEEGDPKVATCTNCHGVHGMLSRKDPRSPVHRRNVPATCARCHNPEYMKGRTAPTDQYALYRTSVHGKALLEKGDLSAPACNNCHGNHGAVPPNTRDISLVCGTCHGREGELFAKSTVKAGLELEGKRGCATCHGNHGVQLPTDALIGTTGAGVCGRCHERGSAGARATDVIVPAFHALKARIGNADSLLDVADRLGMEVEAGRELLKQADDQLVNVRATLHGFDTKQITAVLTEGDGLADQAISQARAALKDWRTRRIGMAVSVVAILLMAGLLVLRIRRLERGAGA